jgi:hypothetical protein
MDRRHHRCVFKKPLVTIDVACGKTIVQQGPEQAELAHRTTSYGHRATVVSKINRAVVSAQMVQRSKLHYCAYRYTLVVAVNEDHVEPPPLFHSRTDV